MRKKVHLADPNIGDANSWHGFPIVFLPSSFVISNLRLHLAMSSEAMGTWTGQPMDWPVRLSPEVVKKRQKIASNLPRLLTATIVFSLMVRDHLLLFIPPSP